MNISHLYHRLEITFWNLVVVALTDRRYVQKVGVAVGVLLLFALVTTLVFTAGQLVLQWTQDTASNTGADSVIFVPAGESERQVNLLLVLVDDMEAEHHVLDGLWYVVYQRSVERVILLPLFPPGDAKESETYSALESLLSIQADGSLNEAFIEEVRLQNIRLDGYVLVDRIALDALLAWTHFSPSGVVPRDAQSHFTGLDQSVAGAGGLSQSQFLQRLCSGKPEWSSVLLKPTNWNRLRAHIVMQMHGQIQSLPDWLEANANWSCELPVAHDLLTSP